MAHRTGLYSERQYKADIRKEEYAVIFFRTCKYYYPQMSDSVEPSYELLDEYKVEVLKWRKDIHTTNSKVADHLSETLSTGTIDKDTANKIYWNLKNRNLTFEQVRKCFELLK